MSCFSRFCLFLQFHNSAFKTEQLYCSIILKANSTITCNIHIINHLQHTHTDIHTSLQMATTTKTTVASWRSGQSHAESYKGFLSTPVSGCSVCRCNRSDVANGTDRLNDSDSRKGLNGLITWLPQQRNISPDSCAFQKLNSGAFNHPCVVIETSQCAHLVFCLQVTSFRDGTIQDKYSRCRNPREKDRIFNEYLALRNHDTVAHNQLGELD